MSHEKFLSSFQGPSVGVACQERRHTELLYLAKAVSFRDLLETVKGLVPEGTPIPSKQWLRYQFQPINPRAKTAKYFKAKMIIKMMVQKRQVPIDINKSMRS